MANFIVPADPDCTNDATQVGYTAGAERAEQVFAAAGDYYLSRRYRTSRLRLVLVILNTLGNHHFNVAVVCEVAAEPGDDIEAEVCETDTNGGCNNLPDSPASSYEIISAGVTFCWDLLEWCRCDPADPELMDVITDWMLYDHPGGAIIYTNHHRRSFKVWL